MTTSATPLRDLTRLVLRDCAAKMVNPGSKLEINPSMLSGMFHSSEEVESAPFQLRQEVERISHDFLTVRLADPALFARHNHLPGKNYLYLAICPFGADEGILTELAEKVTLYSLSHPEGLVLEPPASTKQVEAYREHQRFVKRCDGWLDRGRDAAADMERQLHAKLALLVHEMKDRQVRAWALEILAQSNRLPLDKACALCSALDLNAHDVVSEAIGQELR